MDLILWRHAEAEEPDVGADDLSRALTPKGERQAERMAEWLNRRLAHSTRALVSPALRQRVIDECLVPYLHDRQDAWALQPDGRYLRVGTDGPSAQQALMNLYNAGA